jgi:hypothetical protein
MPQVKECLSNQTNKWQACWHMLLIPAKWENMSHICNLKFYFNLRFIFLW